MLTNDSIDVFMLQKLQSKQARYLEAMKKGADVLESFFQPFEKVKNYDQATEGRIIAINEGRLVEFLTTSKKHQKLAKPISVL